MPANYAHNRFGKLVMACPGEWLKKYERLFLAGCHGPDPLFYYDPFGPNEIRDLAEKIHGTSGKILFTDLCQVVREETEGPGWAFSFSRRMQPRATALTGIPEAPQVTCFIMCTSRYFCFYSITAPGKSHQENIAGGGKLRSATFLFFQKKN